MNYKTRQRAGVAATTVLVAIILLFLWSDPYSHGHIGGEYAVFTRDFTQLRPYPWQIGASVFLTLFLGWGLVQVFRSRPRSAMVLFAAEGVTFLVLNLLYVFRDGLQVRATSGDQGDALAAEVTLTGMVLRVILLLVVIQCCRAEAA
jgi:hypothetical protein